MTHGGIEECHHRVDEVNGLEAMTAAVMECERGEDDVVELVSESHLVHHVVELTTQRQVHGSEHLPALS